MTEYQHRPDQGGSGGGGFEKQFILYLFFAFALVLIFQGVFFKQPAKPAPAEQKQTATPVSSSSPAAAPTATGKAPAAASKAPAATAITEQAASENQIVVENDLYKVTFTNRGAQVKSWQLKKFKNDKGEPLDLVNDAAAAQAGLPLSLWTYDENLRQQLNSGLYVTAPQTAAHLTAPATLSFVYAQGGLEVHKSFKFDDSYVVQVETSVTQNGAPVQAFPAWPSALGDETSALGYQAGMLDWQTPSGVTHMPAFEKNFIRASRWVANGDTLRDTFNWIGVSDQYFAAFFMPAQPGQTAAVTLNQTLDLPKNPGDPNDKETLKVQALGVAVGSTTGPTTERLFVGPKAVDVLHNVYSSSAAGVAKAGPNLRAAIDFGFFGFFAKGLFLWLNWTHDHWVANWGWVIVILTFIINLVFLPMRLSQMKTSLKMQKVQPRVKDINKKYEKYGLRDTEKQQQKQAEIMALYKEHDISPFGGVGCLFLVVQIPLIWAFYAVLRNSIELRQAHWLWIHDLSLPDPMHILPVLTIVTMYFMQSMTPMPGMDASQRRMMNVMMIGVFGWITWLYSAGLALYLAVSYGINVVQQFFLNRSELGREIREIQAKRARKQQGKGK